MKKIFTLAIIAFMGAASMQAQNIIVNNAGIGVLGNGSGNDLTSAIVAASTVKSMEVLPSEKTSVASESEGSYAGETVMSFTMLPGVMPETIAGNTDTVTVTPIGGNRVQVTFASEMGHAILTQKTHT